MVASHAQQTCKDDNSLTTDNDKKFLTMPIHDTIKLITTSIAGVSSLPAMGPSNHMLRNSGFKKGLVLADGEFVTYSAARKVALIMELRARGLLSTGSVPELKHRLQRSDTNTLLAPDWGPLPGDWDITSLDSEDMTVSSMEYAEICDKLKAIDALPPALPTGLPVAGEAQKRYCLWLVRQFLVFSLANRDATEHPPAAGHGPSDGGSHKRKAEDELEEVERRTLRIQQFLLRPGQDSARRRLLKAGSADFQKEVASLVRAVVLQGVIDGQAVDSTDDLHSTIRSIMNLATVDAVTTDNDKKFPTLHALTFVVVKVVGTC